MTLRFGSIIIHKPDPNSETDNSNISSSDEAEVAEVAETATTKYNNKKQSFVRKAERHQRRTVKSRSMAHRRSSVSSSESGGDVSILRILNGDRSPPFVRSHYFKQPEDRLHETEAFSQRNQKRNSANRESDMNGDRLGFRVSTSGSRTTDKANDRRCASYIVPDTVSSFTTPFVPIIDDGAAINGISKLLKNLNFAEKLRQQKAEQQRLNINNLPQSMKEQLKHMYVY